MKVSERFKTVAMTLLVVAAVIAIWLGAGALRREAAPGKEAAAYLDALIRLGKMPTPAQVNEWLKQAQAGAQVVTAPPPEAKPEAGKK